MKKLSILLIGLLLATGFVFAQEATVSGSATLTFGVDLDNGNASGFTNEASSSLSIAWLSGDSATSGTQGWITLGAWSVSISGDGLSTGAPSVSAGWTFDPITITIYAGPSFSSGNAASFSFNGDDATDVAAIGIDDVTLSVTRRV